MICTYSKSAVLLAAILLAAGCADKIVESEINGRIDTIHSRLETAKAPAAERLADPLQVTDSVWLGGAAVELKRGVPLPEEWEQNNSIAVRSDNPIGLSQIAGIIASQTKIPLRMTGGAGETGTSSSGGGDQPRGERAQAGGNAVPEGMILSYEGKLSGLLDLVCSYFNVNWTYVNGTIDISRYETRTFVLDALPGSIDMSASAGAPGASGGAASSATAVPLASASIDIWADINTTLDEIVGDEGSVTISQSSGTVVVSTTSDRMERIASYIQEENRRLSRQVAVTIELYTVAVNDDQDYQLDLDPVIDVPGNLIDLALGGVPLDALNGGSVAVSLLNPNAVAGSSAVFEALNTLGKATRVAQIPMTTLNNRPAIQRIAVDRSYAAEVSTTTSGTDTVSTEITTDTVTTGVSVSVLPRLMSDGRLLLQYALAQGALVQLREFSSGDSTVQLPETQGLSFSQQVMMKNGSTLILAGFDESNIGTDHTTPVRGLGLMLGGASGTTHSRQLVVIAITPREIVVSNPEAS